MSMVEVKLDVYNRHLSSDQPVDIILALREQSYSAVLMQPEVVEGGKKAFYHQPLAFIGKIFSDAMTQYPIPELEFHCISDILKRYAYLLYGQKIRIHVQYMWPELSTLWPYLSRRMQKATLRIREFGAEVVQIGNKMKKMLEFLEEFLIDPGDRKIPKLEVETEYANYFQVQLNDELEAKLKNLRGEQELDVRLMERIKKYPKMYEFPTSILHFVVRTINIEFIYHS